MSVFYHIDSTRMTHEEYWWGAKSPLVLIAWLTKWLRIRLPSSADDPNVDSTLPFVVEALPAEIALRFQPIAAELERLQFIDPIYHVIYDPGTQTTIYWATYRHVSGQYLARIHNRIWLNSQKPDRGLFPVFMTAYEDGTWLVSSAGKPDLLTPETVQMNRMHGAIVSALWADHQLRVATAAAQKTIAPIANRDELIAAVERHHELLRDFNLARGAFRPRTAAEAANATQTQASMAQAEASGYEHAAVMAELEKLQTQKPGWGNALILLVASLIGFFAAGAAQWDWKSTLWLVPILFFHEAGHWVAMRLCHYRNLRMFFIPFFGAAVTGQNWNVPGWKKALVSLSGPVPGIVLGTVLGIVALVMDKPILNQAALMLLLLNGFNLLPILPLDGGHVLHATLFCRNRWLDSTFRVVAVVGLVLLGLAGTGRFLLYIGIAIGVGLPVAFKLAKLTDELRKEPALPLVNQQGAIPQDTAHRVIARLKTDLPKSVNNKTLAQHTLNVIETLNARPPGVLATLALLAVHFSSVVVVVVLGVLLTIGRHGGLGDFARTAARQPEHSLEVGEIKKWRGTQAAEATSRNVIITTVKRHQEARTAYAELAGKLPSSAKLLLFGDSLLLSLPSSDSTGRERWFNDLQARSTNTFVALTNRGVGCSLFLVATNGSSATNLANELHHYFALAPHADLIPPWSPAAARREFGASRRAREMWSRIDEVKSEAQRNSSTKDFGRKFIEASRRGATEEVARLQAEQKERIKEAMAKADALLRREAPERMDIALLDLHGQLEKLSYTNRAARAEIYRQVATKLGELPREGGQPEDGTQERSTVFGFASPHGLLVEMSVTVRNPTDDLPALVNWLHDKGCRTFKYDLDDFGGAFGGMFDDNSP